MADVKRGVYRWPKPRRSFRRWLAWRLWRLKRWNARQNCIGNHHHGHEDQQVAGTAARVAWCRVCSSVEWID